MEWDSFDELTWKFHPISCLFAFSWMPNVREAFAVFEKLRYAVCYSMVVYWSILVPGLVKIKTPQAVA